MQLEYDQYIFFLPLESKSKDMAVGPHLVRILGGGGRWDIFFLQFSFQHWVYGYVRESMCILNWISSTELCMAI